MAVIDWDHDSMAVTLGPGVSVPWLVIWGLATPVTAGVFVRGLAFHSAPLVILAAVACAWSIYKFFYRLGDTKRRLNCDGKTLDIGDRQRRSLLDIKNVFAKGNRLHFEPELGPLQPFSAGPFRESPGELERVADLLNTAIAQAQHKRGDAPNREFFKMHEVMKQTD